MIFKPESIEHIRDHLIEQNETIAVAESVTSGLLQAALASAERASEFFEGGLTAYNIDQKVKHLGINRKEAETCNCVSEEIAKQMASGVAQLFGTDWSIAVTGYATPVEESGFQVFAYYTISRQQKPMSSGKIELSQKGEEAQIEYVNRILADFSTLIC